AAFDGLHGVARAALHAFDDLLDLGGGLGGAAGQVAHLVGDHGEAATLLAGAGGLDGGVEGQEVGLLGDAVNDFQHRADARAVIGQAVHHLGGVGDLRADAVHAADHLAHGLLALLAGAVGGVRR